MTTDTPLTPEDAEDALAAELALGDGAVRAVDRRVSVEVRLAVTALRVLLVERLLEFALHLGGGLVVGTHASTIRRRGPG